MKFTVGPGNPLALGVLAMLLLAPLAVRAGEAVSVKNAWARAAVPGQAVAGAYMELTAEADAALVAVESPLAARAELHNMTMEGGVMKMRPIERIDLPARQTVRLAPGGLHVMLLGIKAPLTAGDEVPVVLTVEVKGGAKSAVAIRVPVRPVGSVGPQHRH